jgi:hypothetical protein
LVLQYGTIEWDFEFSEIVEDVSDVQIFSEVQQSNLLAVLSISKH